MKSKQLHYLGDHQPTYSLRDWLEDMIGVRREAAICAHCKHQTKVSLTPPWLKEEPVYYLGCGAREYPIGIDPTTGKKSHYREVDRRGVGHYSMIHSMPYCEEVNPEGRCRLFRANDDGMTV